MSALWTAAQAADATGGQVQGDWVASGVSIDTRSLVPGDLFVALKDQRDGHDFVVQALEQGAAAALVSRRPDGVAPDAPLLIVDDVQAGLEALGRAGRARSRARVIGVTGSVGKTSTKDMLRVALTGQGQVHAAEKSFNNHWGVPLTLARLPQAADFAVIEIGMNHPGEIAPLARLAAPDVALITTIAPAHMAAFDSLEGIAREKAAIFTGLGPGGVAVINADLDQSALLRDAAGGAHVVDFGKKSSEYKLLSVDFRAEASILKARCAGQDLWVKLRSCGTHFAMNALGVLAVCDALGLDLALAAVDLGHWAPPDGRGGCERLVLDPVEDDMAIELIDDAFNANPTSMAAAFETLARIKPRDDIGRVAAGRRIAILGDMLELGPQEAQMHTDLATLPGFDRITLCHCVGPLMRQLYDALPPAQRGQWVAAAQDLAPRARHLVDAGDVVLVKGSKGSQVSLVVDALRKLGQAVSDRD